MERILLIKVLYGAAAIQGLVLAFLLARVRNNQPANRILAILLFLVSFHLILVGFDEREFFMTFPHLSRISWIIGTLYGPLVFLFIQQTLRSFVKTHWKFLLFVPFLIVLVNLLPYFFQSAREKRAYLNAFELAMQDDFGWINQFVAVIHIMFVVGNLAFYLDWERKQSDEHSTVERVRVKWIRQFLVFMALVTFFGVSVFFARTWNVAFLSGFYRFHFVGVVLLFYWVSYKALRQPMLFGIFYSTAAFPPLRKKQKPRRKGEVDAVFQKVRSVLEGDRLYLKSDLTLTELANRAGYGRNQVSEAINTSFQGNFFDFVNDFRVEEFKRQALKPEKKHLSQLGIALESGFNSKASFYAVIKKKTGMTPAEFIEKQSEVVK